MRHAAFALMTAATLGLAGPALAQGNEPQRTITQPPTDTVPNPSSGTANSSAGPTRPGGNSGNSASQPERPSGNNPSPLGTTTEAPSLEMRQVTPEARPDRQQGNR
ncbi:hypothetical protein [Roseomonas marmotae]|uniref:Translation initiation factor IF-2 n=1 Tax=Roseomonas marmotae TaxID=2768161 RepID=A0ABS3KEQ1_9PROT|nr:hypothetical protein [Roseomonas marmotae]MBO1075925.1 hypothetical protein [Roseomonas marmotae]QTI81892.1 hypothetical protein IAI58_21375 [Roseomonas marmotae]